MNRSRWMFGLLLVCALSACQRDRVMDEWILNWDGRSGAELLEAIREQHPTASVDAKRQALDRVARGPYSAASSHAAAALCRLAGLGDPCATANQLYNESDQPLTEPQWFLWIAGYSYNWICNSGLSACYFEFDEKQFADRIRVYDAIGAHQAAAALRAADRLFGPTGPAKSIAGRQAAITDSLYEQLGDLSPRMWECGDEIYTRVYLYALDHADDFRDRATERESR
ncbi:MAG: DUF4375 domain-containing protein [Planctomycetota bacterium]